MIKRTKIICTIGPASQSPAMLKQMIASGMNVARLNMSHGTYPAHRALIKAILSASKAQKEPVTLLADLQGPKIRLGVLPEAGVQLKTGGYVEFTTASDVFSPPYRGGVGGGGVLPVTHKAMHKDVKVGHRIFIDDGLLEVKVTKVHGQTVMAKVVNGGTVTSHKGMNFPDTTLSVDPITDKDKADLAFALKAGVQWIAMSFVTTPGDVSRLRKMMTRPAKIIVKIEKHEALKNFDAILKVADGIMVARGDLGVETPAEDVPLRQKEIIGKCRAAGKPVVVATQMLDSMIRNPRPTRAEVSDVANAVIDHTEAVMLSAESATGMYPLEAVKMMAKICSETEASVFDDLPTIAFEHKMASGSMIAATLATLARLKKIDAIVTALDSSPLLSKEGLGVVALLNQYRPEVPIYLATETEDEARAWNIRWGMQPFVLNKKGNALAQLKQMKRLKKGDRVALIINHGKPQIEIVIA